MSLKERVQNKNAVQVPEGYYTAKEWCDKLDASMTNTNLTLRRGVSMGIVDCKKFRVLTSRGLFPTPYYKELPDDTHTTSKAQSDSNGNHKHPAPTKPLHGKGQPRGQDAGRKAKASNRTRKG